MRLLSCATLVAWLVLALAACGSSTSDGTTDGSGAGSPTPEETCATACAKLVMLGCSSAADCQKGCAATLGHSGACADVVTAFLECEAASATACEDVHSCAAEQTAVDKCGGSANCLEDSMEGTNNSCSGTAGCSTGRVEAKCTFSAGAPADCTCTLGGKQVGTCQSTDFSTACDPTAGCCAQFF